MIRYLVDRWLRKHKFRAHSLTHDELVAEGDKSPGVLLASGYIAGGALAGIVIGLRARPFGGGGRLLRLRAVLLDGHDPAAGKASFLTEMDGALRFQDIERLGPEFQAENVAFALVLLDAAGAPYATSLDDAARALANVIERRLRPWERRAVRQGRGDEHIALILEREECGRDARKTNDRDRDAGKGNKARDAGMLRHPGDEARGEMTRPRSAPSTLCRYARATSAAGSPPLGSWPMAFSVSETQGGLTMLTRMPRGP